MTPCLKCTECLRENFTACLNPPAAQDYRAWSRSKWGALKPLTLDARTASLAAGAMGLAGEAGEVDDLIKKHVFHGHPLDEKLRAKLFEELGDVYFYFNQLLIDLGVTVEHIEFLNRKKLDERYPAGFDSERSMKRTGE